MQVPRTRQAEASPLVHDRALPTEVEPASPPPKRRFGGRRRRAYVAGALAVIVAVAIALAATGVFSDSSQGSTATTQAVTVSRGPLSQTVTAQGTVAAAQTDELNFTSSGTVTAVNVKAGDKVQSGQVLATIDSAQLTSDVSAAQATVTKAQAQLSDDEAAGATSAQVAADQGISSRHRTDSRARSKRWPAPRSSRHSTGRYHKSTSPSVNNSGAVETAEPR